MVVALNGVKNIMSGSLKKNLNVRGKKCQNVFSGGIIIGCKDKTSSWHLNGFPVVVTLGQQYHVGEKATVMLYIYIDRHAGTPNKTKTKDTMGLHYSSACNIISRTVGYFQHVHFMPIVGVGKRGV